MATGLAAAACFVSRAGYARDEAPAVPEAPAIPEAPAVGPASKAAPGPFVLPPRFGARGQVVLSGSSVIGASHTTYEASDASSTTFEFSPGVDVFVLTDVSVGLDVDASYLYDESFRLDGSLTQNQTTRVAVAPRVGLDVPLGRVVSWWPRFTAGYETITTLEKGASGGTTGDLSATPTTHQSGAFLKVAAPLLFHVIPRFYFGFGPTLYHQFGSVSGALTAGGGQATTLGMSFVVGAFCGGEVIPVAEPPPRARREGRFGDAGEFVLTGALQSGYSGTSHAGNNLTTSYSASIRPGLDYFVADHVSLGIGAEFALSQAKQVDALSGTTQETTVRTEAIAVTLGADAPLGSWFSLYPRASLAIGFTRSDRTDDMDASSEDATRFSVGLFVPLLVHPGPRVFVGFGPDVGHDLSRSYTLPSAVSNAPAAPSRENRATSSGAALLFGGWF